MPAIKIAKPSMSLTNAALAVLADHIHPDADKAEDREPGIGVHHLGDEAVTLEAGQRQQPAGDVVPTFAPMITLMA